MTRARLDVSQYEDWICTVSSDPEVRAALRKKICLERKKPTRGRLSTILRLVKMCAMREALRALEKSFTEPLSSVVRGKGRSSKKARYPAAKA